MSDQAHQFKLETSPNGQRTLTVWYVNRDWEAAIAAGLSAYGLNNDRAIQIIAVPAGCSWGSGQ